MKVIHLLIVFILCSSLCQAQIYSMQNFNVAKGMPSSEVYDIFQDSNGFIWFATDNGVAKYDGFDFKNFNIADGLPDPVVFEIMEDASGKIWFRTFSGKIAYVENEKIHPYKFNEQLAKVCADSYLFSMIPDNQGQLWFTTWTKHWGRITKQGDVIKQEIPEGVLIYKSVGQHHIIGQMRSPTTGIEQIVINDSTFQVELSDSHNDSKKSHATCRSIFWRGNQYITINNNIFRYNGTNVTRVYRGHAAIISVSKDHQDNLWVGFLNGGAIRFDYENFENGKPLTAIGSNSATRVIEDTERGLWVSTLEKGVYYIPNLDIQHFSLNSESKVDVAISTGEQIITGEYDGTITRIDIKSKKMLSKVKFDRSILTILKTKKQLWVGAETIYLLNEQNHKTKLPFYITVRDLCEDRDGNVWGIEGLGVLKHDENGKQIFWTRKNIAGRNIISIDSVLIIGVHTGLNIYDHDLNLLKAPKQLESLKISKVVQVGDSMFLIATVGNGFLLTKNFDQFTHYQTPARNIYDVAQYDSIILLATEKGILKSTIKSLLTQQPTYDFLTNRNGLLDQQASHLILVENELFVIYSNSFSVIPMTQGNYINRSPVFYVKSLKVNNQIRENPAQLDLNHDQNNIQIDFGFISFNNQDIITRYRLNQDQSWNDLSERTIDLFSLGPGEYPIELQYSVDNIHWTKAALIPAIHISPAWWQTIEFQVSFIVGIIALIYLFFNNRLIIYRQRNEKMRLLGKQQQLLIQKEIKTLERERNRIAKDLHDSVGTNILATKLTVNRLLKKHQEPEGDVVEQQFQETMMELKEIIYNLSPPGLERYGLATGLKNYIDRISASTVVSFNVNTFGKDLINTTLSVPLFRILQELITNSLKHSNSKSISIHLNSFDDLYNVVYEDQGVGFSMEGNHKGLGLHNIESRVKSINGKMNFESGPFGISYSIDVPIKNNFLRD